MSSPDFVGATVLSFESRKADATARLIKKRGGRPISAPSMQEVPLDSHDDVFVFADRLFAGDVDLLILTTGVGTRMLIEAMATRHDEEAIKQRLSAVTTVARGPKPVRALKKNDIPVDLKVPEPNTWEEILQVLDEKEYPLEGRRVAVQEYGRSNEKLLAGLTERGAEILRVPIYRWALPDDTEPLKRGLKAIIDGEVDVVLFTSRTQVDHALKVARRQGWEDDLRAGLRRAVVASIGPVCSKGLTSHDIAVDFEPERPKLGVFIRDVARTFSQDQASTA